MRLPVFVAALSLGVGALVLGASPARAQEAEPAAAPPAAAKTPAEREREREAEIAEKATFDPEAPPNPESGFPHPSAADLRTGHVVLAARAGLAAPFGSIATGRPFGEIVGAGLGFGGVLSVGLSRYVSLDASGGYARYGEADRCIGCTASAIDAGLGLTYHLAQGFALDPWIAYGVGYRTAAFEVPAALALPRLGSVTSARYHGLDVARIGLGADFLPVPGFGFGPFAELDLGTFLRRPGANAGSSTYGSFQLGLRIAFDPAALLRGAPPPADRQASRGGTALR